MSKKKKKAKKSPLSTLNKVFQVVDDGVTAYRSFKKGNVVEGIGSTLRAVNNAYPLGVQVVKAITGIAKSENDEMWYCMYERITPAKNLGRQMAPRMNEDITKNPTQGSVPRFIDVELTWADYTQSFAFNQSITNAMQVLRLAMKSNLPYSQNKLKAYMINAISLSIALKEVERDVNWRNFSTPDIYNFQDMFISRATEVGGYGVTALKVEDYLSDAEWADTQTSYARLAKTTQTCIRIPTNLGMFISHYFGSVFTDSQDGYNTQFIINRMHTLPFATYNKEDDSITVTMLDLTGVSLNALTQMVIDLGVDFSIVIADLVKSNQYAPLYMDALESYHHVAVYDQTYLQALINGYTSASAVTSDGYIRLDEMAGVSDKLTQYIFAGAIQPNVVGLNNIPTFSIVSMVYKIDSDSDLKWSAALDQFAGDVSDFTKDGKFGLQITTDISVDEYASVTASINEAASSDVYLTIGYRLINLPSSTSAGTLKSISMVSNLETKFTSGTYNFETTYLATENGKILQGVGTQAAVAVPAGSGNYQVEVVIPVASIGTSRFPTTPPFTPTDQDSSVIYGIGYSAMISSSNLSASDYEVTLESRGYVRIPITGLSSMGNTGGNNIGGIISAIHGASSSNTLINPLLAGETVSGFSSSDIGSVKATIVEDATPSRYRISNVRIMIGAGNTANTSAPVTLSAKTGHNATLLIRTINTPMCSRIDAPRINAKVETPIQYVVTADISGGFEGLAALTADWFDWHIPINMTVTRHLQKSVTINGQTKDNTNTPTTLAPILIKEAYAPYYYNIKDLTPVLYSMWNSLFTSHPNIYSVLASGFKKDADRYAREKERREKSDYERLSRKFASSDPSDEVKK